MTIVFTQTLVTILTLTKPETLPALTAPMTIAATDNLPINVSDLITTKHTHLQKDAQPHPNNVTRNHDLRLANQNAKKPYREIELSSTDFYDLV